jgi:uncharacterized protein (DUF58 family)
VLQLRDYRPGDPQHVIDWKADRRSNRLVSRDFSEDQHLKSMLAIDAGRASCVTRRRSRPLRSLSPTSHRVSRSTQIAHDDQVGLVIFATGARVDRPGRGVGTVARIRAMLSLRSRPLPNRIR